MHSTHLSERRNLTTLGSGQSKLIPQISWTLFWGPVLPCG